MLLNINLYLIKEKILFSANFRVLHLLALNRNLYYVVLSSLQD